MLYMIRVLGEMRYGHCHGYSLEGAVQELQCTDMHGEAGNRLEVPASLNNSVPFGSTGACS